MNIADKKEEIKLEIDKIQDEQLIQAIARLLHLDDESEIPEWHKQILEEREAKYQRGEMKFKDWDEVKKNL